MYFSKYVTGKIFDNDNKFVISNNPKPDKPTKPSETRSLLSINV